MAKRVRTRWLFGAVAAANTAPDAVDDTASTDPGIPVVINVLANDSDADTGDTLTITNVTDPANGTAVK